jgi:hypothetical protein
MMKIIPQSCEGTLSCPRRNHFSEERFGDVERSGKTTPTKIMQQSHEKHEKKIRPVD